jgi:hypothetical protein
MFKTKTQFKTLTANNPVGRVCVQTYESNGEKKNLAFALITPRESGMKCSECNLSVWNATNFTNDIHFCPHREITVEITEFIVFKQ